MAINKPAVSRVLHHFKMYMLHPFMIMPKLHVILHLMTTSGRTNAKEVRG